MKSAAMRTRLLLVQKRKILCTLLCRNESPIFKSKRMSNFLKYLYFWCSVFSNLQKLSDPLLSIFKLQVGGNISSNLNSLQDTVRSVSFYFSVVSKESPVRSLLLTKTELSLLSVVRTTIHLITVTSDINQSKYFIEIGEEIAR